MTEIPENLKVGVFGTDFKQVPFVFRQTSCTYSESWGPIENFCDPPPLWGGGEKITQKSKFGSKNFFLLILPKKIVSLLKIDFD